MKVMTITVTVADWRDVPHDDANQRAWIAEMLRADVRHAVKMCGERQDVVFTDDIEMEA